MIINCKSLVKLNGLRLRLGYNKTEFSQKIGLSKPMTVQICNGTRHPSPRSAKKICDALQVEFDDIFEIVTSEKKQEGEHKKIVR